MRISTIFKYYWPYVVMYKWSGLAVLVTYGLATFMSHLLVPLIYKELVDIVTNAQFREVVAGDLFSLILILAVLILVYNILYRLGDWAMVYSQSAILKHVANNAYKRLHKHSHEFFANRFAGSLVTKVKRFIRSFEQIHDQIIFAVWMNGLRLILTIIALAMFAKDLLIVFFVWIVAYFFVSVLLLRIQYRRDVERAAAESKTTGVLADTITNVLNIKMFASLRHERSIFNKAVTTEKVKRERSWYFNNYNNAFQGIFIGLFEVIIMYFAIKLWVAGSISAGVIVLIQIYVFYSFDIVWNISRNIRRVMEAFADAQEMVEIFEQEADVKDVVSPEHCAIGNGEIDIKDITFAYEHSNNVFENFSLKIASGERIGLVGHSGSGKTTITKLLLRFADVQSGEIAIDGQDISKIKQDDLRRNISYVPQEPMLFHRSLAENIAYAKPDATMEEIEEVAKKAHAHEFIQKLPDGYDTLVGERGIKLSGGERQRVAIARAMLKDAPIVILDEATSALDSVSEHYIQDALHKLLEGKTVLVVAHRLSTVQSMDRIVVFESGKKKEEGTHTGLLERKGAYYKFWQQQSGGMLVD